MYTLFKSKIFGLQKIVASLPGGRTQSNCPIEFFVYYNLGDINQKLIRLCESKNTPSLKDIIFLLGHDADVNFRDRHNYDDALGYACMEGHLETVKVLLRAGADIHNINFYGLVWASESDHLEIVKILLEAGADVHLHDDKALRWASQLGHLEVVKVLLKAGANVHAKNDDALRMARSSGHSEVVELFTLLWYRSVN